MSESFRALKGSALGMTDSWPFKSSTTEGTQPQRMSKKRRVTLILIFFIGLLGN
jgi:hypothetical protein